MSLEDIKKRWESRLEYEDTTSFPYDERFKTSDEDRQAMRRLIAIADMAHYVLELCEHHLGEEYFRLKCFAKP